MGKLGNWVRKFEATIRDYVVALSYLRRRHYVLALILISVALRVLAIVVFDQPTPEETVEFGVIARNIAGGNGFSYNWTNTPTPTAYMPPVYPVILAISYAIFGIDSPAAFYAMTLFQVVVGTATVVLLYMLGRLIFGESVGRIAGIVLAIHPGFVFMPTQISSITLFMLFAIGSMYLYRRSTYLAANKSGRLLLLAGLVAGAASLIRAEFLLFVIMLIVLHVGRRKLEPKFAGIFLIGLLLLVGSWGIRNYVELSTVTLTANSTYLNLWRGNNPESNGYIGEYEAVPTTPWLTAKLQENRFAADYEVLRESAYRRVLVEYITDQPVRFVRGIAVKTFYFVTWVPRKADLGYIVYLIYYAIILTGAIISIRQHYQTKKFDDMLMVFMAYSVIWPVVFQILPRYRLFLEPILALFAAAAIVHFVGRKSDRWKQELSDSS